MTKEYFIDINADLGEGKGNDEKLMPLLSSCNIACGGHVGNETSMREAIQLAQQYNVKIGAHPSFPDKDNFGRKVLTMTKSELKQSVFEQILAFYAVAETENASVHHIKLHGAIYNYTAKDAPTADAVVEAIIATKARPVLYVPHNSVLHGKAENLLPLSFEAFIDRHYNDDLSLVSRSEDDAVIHDAEIAWNQLRRMVVQKEVKTLSGQIKPISADTFCIHGDNPKALNIMKHILAQMEKHNIKLNR